MLDGFWIFNYLYIVWFFHLVLLSEQPATAERRATAAEERATAAEQRAERLAAKLRELNIDLEE